MMRSIRRSVWQVVAVVVGLLMLALGLLFFASFRSLERLRPVHQHLARLHKLQLVVLDMQEVVLDSVEHRGALEGEEGWVNVQENVKQLIASNGYLADTTAGRLELIAGLLSAEEESDPEQRLLSTLQELRVILRDETAAHDKLFGVVERDTELEFAISAALTLSLPLIAVASVFFMRRRLLLPLHNLRELMAALGQPDYHRVSTSDIDPLLRPIFENYNHMAARLAELEKKHRDRQNSLEEEVRLATRALLRQQGELSRSERLAAVGEMAAGVAHELRNPLAGIQMALAGIRRDTQEAECGTRLDLVITELKRVTGLLNDLLSLSRATPERPVEIELDELVKELATLLKYQLPEEIRLKQDIPSDLRCRLPEDGLRQALLNLILNGAQAIGDRRGEIVVSASLSIGRLKISVSDDGPGFPDSLLESGIRAFGTRRQGGTGLGLATVRRFAHDVGGDLVLNNLEPNGACATIELPEKVAHASHTTHH